MRRESHVACIQSKISPNGNNFHIIIIHFYHSLGELWITIKLFCNKLYFLNLILSTCFYIVIILLFYKYTWFFFFILHNSDSNIFGHLSLFINFGWHSLFPRGRSKCITCIGWWLHGLCYTIYSIYRTYVKRKIIKKYF